jgi:CheY-like chemotaxis protein
MHTPDWILLDMHLPDMGGEDVLHALRQNPRTQGIPVTVLSADVTPGQFDRLKAAGAREYLTKPLDVRQLIGLLEETLHRQQPEIPAGERVVRASGLPATSFGRDPEVISLTNVSPAILQQLRSAVQDGEKDRMNKLIAAVADQDPRSAEALRQLADKYEYDTLTSLLAEAGE